jgi:hypothetical protein
MFSALFGNQTRIGIARLSRDDPSRIHRGMAARVSDVLEANGNADSDLVRPQPGQQAPERDDASHAAPAGPESAPPLRRPR